MDGGSNSNKRQVEAQRHGESSSKRQNVTMGLETLDCSVCLEPLRPPIFQCSVGHFICSFCRAKLLDKKCNLCSPKTSFKKRCFGMEHVVQSVTVPCSNAKHGCTAKVVYYQKGEHEKVCPNAPCFCPESGCSFAGKARALMDHLTTQHKCRLTTFDNSSWRSSCKIRSSSLSDGLPPGYDLIVPKSKVSDEGNIITITIRGHAVYPDSCSDDDGPLSFSRSRAR